MLKRDLSYELFSREPEGWAEWAGFARGEGDRPGILKKQGGSRGGPTRRVTLVEKAATIPPGQYRAN